MERGAPKLNVPLDTKWENLPTARGQRKGRNMRARIIATIAGAWLAAAVLPATAEAFRTKATIYHAFTSTGALKFTARTVSGSCFSGAISIDRKDAWRCISGNALYDPCFSTPLNPSVVACPDSGLRRGVKMLLTKKLPRKFADHGSPTLKDQPWNIQTASYRHYVYSSGASSVLDGERANYFSRGVKAALWGFPSRATEPWTILWAPFNATSLHQRVRIRHAWM